MVSKTIDPGTYFDTTSSKVQMQTTNKNGALFKFDHLSDLKHVLPGHLSYVSVCYIQLLDTGLDFEHLYYRNCLSDNRDGTGAWGLMRRRVNGSN